MTMQSLRPKKDDTDRVSTAEAFFEARIRAVKIATDDLWVTDMHHREFSLGKALDRGLNVPEGSGRRIIELIVQTYDNEMIIAWEMMFGENYVADLLAAKRRHASPLWQAWDRVCGWDWKRAGWAIAIICTGIVTIEILARILRAAL